MEIDKVTQLIRDLAAKTVDRGCTEQEAMRAAEKIGELLKVYDLSLDQVFLDGVKCITVEMHTGKRRRATIDYCALEIARFCDCKIWTVYGKGGFVVYRLFGLEPDTQMAKYLYDAINTALKTETDRYRKTKEYRKLLEAPQYKLAARRRGRGRHLVHSFQYGMTKRISKRLREMSDERDEQEMPAVVAVTPAAVTGTSMVLIKRKKVEEEYESLGLKLVRNHRWISRRDTLASSAGATAADKVNLRRPVEGGPVGLLE